MTKSSVEEHKKSTRKCKFAILTISTSRFGKFAGAKNPDECEDISGKTIREIMTGDGHTCVDYCLIPDDIDKIRDLIRNFTAKELDVIITTGGTGLAPMDVTIEAVKPVLEKEIQGFGELFRYRSMQEIGSAAMLTRAIAGVAKGKVIFCLPGSPNAVNLAIRELILPEISHIVKHVKT